MIMINLDKSFSSTFKNREIENITSMFPVGEAANCKLGTSTSIQQIKLSEIHIT